MATLVSPADFKGQINIANSDDTYNGVPENVQVFIDKYEKKLLIQLFGQPLYDAFKAGLTINPIPEKWTALRDLDGLKDAIADYTYYWFADNEITYSSGQGEVKALGENCSPASAWGKMIRAWNEMVDYNKSIQNFLAANIADYPDFTYNANEYEPFYVNGWFDYEYYYRSQYCEVPEIYRKKNILNL